MIDFWTYTCIYWWRTLPYVRAWAEKYRDQGLVVIGVHAPEFAFEKDLEQRSPGRERRCGSSIRSPWTVSMPSGEPSRTNTGRRCISSMRRGGLRHHQFGEGSYEQSGLFHIVAEAGRGEIGTVAGSVARRWYRSGCLLGSLKFRKTMSGMSAPSLCVPGGVVLDQPRMYELPAGSAE